MVEESEIKQNEIAVQNLEDFILNAPPQSPEEAAQQLEEDVATDGNKIAHIHASLPQVIQSREELNELLPLHYGWLESVLNPSKKIIGGRANISGSDLSGWDLTGVNLAGASLVGCRFVGSVLKKVNLTGCDLRNADFSGAVLVGAKLRRSQLEGATFEDADLKDCDFKAAHGLSIKTKEPQPQVENNTRSDEESEHNAS